MVPVASATCMDQHLSLLTAFTGGCLLQQWLQCQTALSLRGWGQIPSSQNLYFKTGHLLHGASSCPLTIKGKNHHTTNKNNILNCRLQQVPQHPSVNLHSILLGRANLKQQGTEAHHQSNPGPLQVLSHILGLMPTNYCLPLSPHEMLLLPCPAKFQAFNLITYSGSAPRPWEAMP